MSKWLLISVLMFFSIICFSQTLPSFTVAINYNGETKDFDKTKVLNMARGGQGISGNLSWMPKFYDKLVEIGIDEFRVDWLLSNRFYNVVTRSNGVLKYDFTNLDKTIIPMISKGIKPLMCMTYMATPLGKDSFPPNNYEEYSATIRAYVQYYKDKGYTGWAWESHNEPEGFTKLTPAQTYAMFKAFSNAVKSVDPTARVGGFGAVGLDWIGYIRSFLDYYKADGQKPDMDFFSFHQYGRNSWEYVPTIESEFTKRALPIPDLYITEWNNHWGTSPGQGNYGISGAGNSFDTNVNATYIAKKLFSSYLFGNVKKIYYFNFADTNSSKLYTGDMGIFTVDSYHRKSGANTFLMYNRMHDQLLTSYVSGANTADRNSYGFATVDKEANRTSIIMWNYQNAETLSKLIITNLPVLPEGWEYKADKYLIDSTHGNHFHDYSNGWIYLSKSKNEDIKVEKTISIDSRTLYAIDTLAKYSVVQYIVEPRLSTTGLNETYQKKKALNVVPGIVESQTQINFRLETPGNAKLMVCDISGNQFIKKDMGFSDSEINQQYQLNVGFLQSGVYFVVLYCDDRKVDCARFIKK